MITTIISHVRTLNVFILKQKPTTKRIFRVKTFFLVLNTINLKALRHWCFKFSIYHIIGVYVKL